MIRISLYRQDSGDLLKSYICNDMTVDQGVYIIQDERNRALAMFPVSKFYVYIDHDVT